MRRPEGWLEQLRQRALEVAEQLDLEGRASQIEDLVGAVAGTRPARRGAGALLAAKAAGTAYDPRRIDMVDELARYLADIPADLDVPAHLDTPAGDLDGSLPFYEAYFSNFIEGTEFSIAEAEQIIRDGEIPATRPEDAHDVLGTYRVVSDPVGRATVPSDAEHFLELLKLRHSAIMAGRPHKRPGQFKGRPNQAGSYQFVDPDLALGTLLEGFRRVEKIPPGLPRALFQLWLVSEVHPFDDGNGRVARVAMCAELSVVGQSRILIPIVYLNEYMAALRVMSRDGRCDTYVRTLARAWRWTAGMPWHERAAVEGRLHATNALIDSTDAERAGVQLVLP